MRCISKYVVINGIAVSYQITRTNRHEKFTAVVVSDVLNLNFTTDHYTTAVQRIEREINKLAATRRDD